MRTLKFRSYDTVEQAYCPFITDHLDRELYPHIDVQQWTGLLSKDGKEIYEGDILSYEGFTGVVEYDAPEFIINDMIWAMAACEVIGNIYENPELLEAEL